MNRTMFWLLLIGLLLLSIRALADDKPDAVTYFQIQPSKTLPPFSTFNPAITVHKDGKVTKSYFKLPPSTLFPAGSTFNPLISVQDKKGR